MKSKDTPLDTRAIAQPNAYGLSPPPVSNPTSILAGGAGAVEEASTRFSLLRVFTNEVAAARMFLCSNLEVAYLNATPPITEPYSDACPSVSSDLYSKPPQNDGSARESLASDVF